MFATSCTTCRAIRRFFLAFGIGAILAWQVTGSQPFQGEDGDLWAGLMMVAIIFSMISVMTRMRQMRAQMRAQMKAAMRGEFRR